MLVYCLGMTILAAAENGLDPDIVRYCLFDHCFIRFYTECFCKYLCLHK